MRGSTGWTKWKTNLNQSTTMKRRVETTLDDGIAETRCNCGTTCKNTRGLKIHIKLNPGAIEG